MASLQSPGDLGARGPARSLQAGEPAAAGPCQFHRRKLTRAGGRLGREWSPRAGPRSPQSFRGEAETGFAGRRRKGKSLFVAGRPGGVRCDEERQRSALLPQAPDGPSCGWGGLCLGGRKGESPKLRVATLRVFRLLFLSSKSEEGGRIWPSSKSRFPSPLLRAAFAYPATGLGVFLPARLCLLPR